MAIIAQGTAVRRKRFAAPVAMPCRWVVRFGVVPFLLAGLAGAAAAQPPEGPLAPEGTFVRITLDGGVSPFSTVQYDVTVRGRTVIVSLVKESLCYRGQQERIRLVDGESGRALVASLTSLGAWQPRPTVDSVAGRARDSEAPRDAPRYEFWAAWGADMTRFSVPEARLRECPELLRVWTAVRAAVSDRVGALPMRDLFHPAHRLGYLTITATEGASATLDGWDTFPLPVDSLEVVEGDHRVMVVGESGRTREFRVRVVAGGSSRIHVLLDDQE